LTAKPREEREEGPDKFEALMNRGIAGSHTIRQVLQPYWKWAKKNLAESTCKRRHARIVQQGYPGNPEGGSYSGVSRPKMD
jgi:hypothetical protein